MAARKGVSGEHPGDEPARPSLRSEQVEATRRAIVGAGRRLFGARGYADTSIDDIARDARVTKGAVYHHFENKRELFRAVYHDVEADAQQRPAAVSQQDADALDMLVAGMHAYLDATLDPEVQRITLIDAPAVLGLEPEGPTEEQPGYRALRDFVAGAIASGSIVRVDADALTHLIGGSLLQAGLVIARSKDPARARKRIGAALEPMIRGLDARPTDRPRTTRGTVPRRGGPAARRT